MSITNETKRLIDGGILLQLKAAYPTALSPKTILSNLKLIGGMSQLKEPELDERLRYLELKERITREDDPSFRLYLITDDGSTWLDEKNLTL